MTTPTNEARRKAIDYLRLERRDRQQRQRDLAGRRPLFTRLAKFIRQSFGLEDADDDTACFTNRDL